ncbi:MAG: TlpA family protein disulfide reductase, partial [Bacteroidales bacterium]|nr:TlpA family protein disulfide reductase [Bacteroidales bacterium]
WFKTDGSNDWNYGFMKDIAIVGGGLWKYNTVEKTKGTYVIELIQQDKQKTIYAKAGKKESFSIGSSFDNLITHKKVYTSDAGYKLPNDEAYSGNLYGYDSAIYSGFINGYCASMGQSTGMIYVNDMFAGNQNSYTVKINEDGSFRVPIMLYHPQQVLVRIQGGSTSLFLEPGKELFHFINKSSREYSNLYMGNMARINMDLEAVNSIKSYDYKKHRKNVLDKSPEEFKNDILNDKKSAMQQLEKYAKSNFMSQKGLQLKKMELDFNAYTGILSYHFTYSSAYREKYKIPCKQRNLPVDIPRPTNEFYDFVTPELVNNPCAVLCSQFYFLINRIQYADITRYKSGNTIGLKEKFAYLEQQGVEFTPEELELLKENEIWENSDHGKTYRSFNEKYQEAESRFYNKHIREIKKIQSKSDEPKTMLEIAKQMVDSGAVISDEEWEFLNAKKELQESDAGKASREYHKKHAEKSNDFNKKYKEQISKLYGEERLKNSLKLFKELWGIEEGLFQDVITADYYCSDIKKKYNPLSDTELEAIRSKFSNKYIANHIAYINNEIKAEIERNKSKTGYSIYDTPKTDADKVFAEIMKKFEGKAILVDFWATWCGPCRMGMEKMKPMKKELEGANVAFVYITNDSSPENTWKNFIPNVKGEHFRLTRDEWNYLAGKYNIGGIPHYMLVDKNGVVVNNDKLPERNLTQLKELLLKHAN